MNPKCSLGPHHNIVHGPFMPLPFILFILTRQLQNSSGGPGNICCAYCNLALHCSRAGLESYQQWTQHLWHCLLMRRLRNLISHALHMLFRLHLSSCKTSGMTRVGCKLLHVRASASVAGTQRRDTFQQSGGGLRWHEAIHRIDYCVVKSAKAPKANSPTAEDKHRAVMNR